MAAVLIALCAAAVFPAYMNHDAAWYVHMATVWLDGGTLYRDVLDTNPPLIVFLTAVPVWIARVGHLSPPAVFQAAVLVLAAASVALSSRPIRRTWNSEPSRRLVVILLVFALFPFVSGDFGQREHLAAILVAPFVLDACAWAAGATTGRVEAAAAGMLAGLGFAIKPHFAMAWIALEISLAFLLPRARSWRRPAATAAASAMLGYALIVVTLVPTYLPFAREVLQVYAGLNPPAAVILRAPELRIWIVAVAALVFLRLPPRQRAPTVVLFWVATGFLAAALLQRKGWPYHFYPCRAFGLLLFAALIGGIADAYPAALSVIRGGPRTLVAAGFVLTTFWSARALVDARRLTATSPVASLVRVIQHEDRAESLAMLSMRNLIVPAFPAVTYTNVRWVLRHNSLWFLPGLYADELAKPGSDPMFRPTSAMPALERKYFEQIIDDLCARPPRLLLLEPPPPGSPKPGGSLDLIAYYRQDSRFDRIFATYTPIGTVGPLVVYRREADTSCRDQQP